DVIQLELQFTLFPYTTLFRSKVDFPTLGKPTIPHCKAINVFFLIFYEDREFSPCLCSFSNKNNLLTEQGKIAFHKNRNKPKVKRSEEHTSELQSRFDLVCRLL